MYTLIFREFTRFSIILPLLFSEFRKHERASLTLINFYSLFSLQDITNVYSNLQKKPNLLNPIITHENNLYMYLFCFSPYYYYYCYHYQENWYSYFNIFSLLLHNKFIGKMGLLMMKIIQLKQWLKFLH
jgi:hypothetical protein